MIDPNELIKKFQLALDEKWGYIYGTSGGVWTQARQDAATNDMAKKYGQKWVGRKVADCSGLFVWAFKQLGGSMYHGSNTMFRKYSTSSGSLSNGLRVDGSELKAASAVYKVNGTDYHHVGLYIGDGKVIEAKGTLYGVVQSNVTEWDAWSELTGVDYYGSEQGGDKVVATVVASSGYTVNLRKSASATSTLISKVPVGTKVTIRERGDDWCQIEYGAKYGFMMSKFLQFESEESEYVTRAEFNELLKRVELLESR